MKYTLKNENIESYNESDTFSFPKYTSQLINWANQKRTRHSPCCCRSDVRVVSGIYVFRRRNHH